MSLSHPVIEKSKRRAKFAAAMQVIADKELAIRGTMCWQPLLCISASQDFLPFVKNTGVPAGMNV